MLSFRPYRIDSKDSSEKNEWLHKFLIAIMIENIYVSI